MELKAPRKFTYLMSICFAVFGYLELANVLPDLPIREIWLFVFAYIILAVGNLCRCL